MPDIGEEVLRIEDWTVHHPLEHSRKVVDRANLYVRAGEVVGIAGLMGAGRTELAMSVFGRSYGHGITGQLYKNGQEIQAQDVSEAIAHGIAYATEDRKRYGLNLIDDIKRNISGSALGKLASGATSTPTASRSWRTATARACGSRRPTSGVITGKLSGGNQQKVVLSKWMFADPDVLILDEPTRGIDVGAKYEIYTIINADGRAGQGDHRHLLRAARAARHLRPDLRAVGRPDHRRGRRRTRPTRRS